MSIRAVVLGLLLAVLIAALTYVNDAVLGNTAATGTLLPWVIYGVLMAAVVVVRPVLQWTGRGAGRGLSGAELAVIGALGLAACGWPGGGLYRSFFAYLAVPARQYPATPAWQAAQVMRYVPGGDPRVAKGHVLDWAALAERLRGQDAPAAALRAALPADAARVVEAGGPTNELQRAALLDGLNAALGQVTLDGGDAAIAGESAADPADLIRRNRAALAAAWPDVLAAAPRGGPMLVDDAAVSAAQLNGVAGGITDPGRLPWRPWLGPGLLWGTAALLLGLASFGLMLMLHPQWYGRESLAYPVARVVGQLLEGSGAIVARPGFRYAVIAALALHLLNGLAVWWSAWPFRVPLTFNFAPLTQLFPNAARAPLGSWVMWFPSVSLSVVALAYFAPAQVSLSVGLAGYAWLAFSALLIGQGIAMDPETVVLPLSFGAYVAAFGMIAYTGRRYYALAAMAAAGVRRSDELPAAAVWGLRLAVLAALGCGVALWRLGLDPWFAALFVALGLVMLTVLTRVHAESGLFVLFSGWTIETVFVAVFGLGAIGPTQYLVLVFASYLLLLGVGVAPMPMVAGGLALAERAGARVGKVAAPMGVALVVAFLVAGAATFVVLHTMGLNRADRTSIEGMPRLMFDLTTDKINKLAEVDRLASSVQVSGLGRLVEAAPVWQTLGWAGLGAGLLLVVALLRLRLSWWPLHPILLLIWATAPAYAVSASFLLGWATRSVLVGAGGARSYDQARPVMAGLLAGELLAALLWAVVGLGYWLVTRQPPPAYSVW